MRRKFIGLCLALGALALVPATASATFLTDTTGPGGTTTLVIVGSKIKAISDGSAAFSLGGGITMECNENYFTGEVVKNNGAVEATITDAKFQSNLTLEGTKCKSNLGNVSITIPALTNEGGQSHWCIKSAAGDTFNLFGRNCGVEGNGVLTFILEIGSLKCEYKREAAVSGDVTTPTEHKASTLTVTGEPVFKRENEAPLCPAEIKITSMKFNLFTDTATPEETNLWDDAKSTGDPVWASEPE